MSRAALLQTILDEAVAATGSATGLVTTVVDGRLLVAATSGGVGPRASIGAEVPAAGARGHALGSGQPTALVPAPDDASNVGIGGAVATPSNLLVAPGGDLALIELADRAGGGAYTFDDIEIVASYATIAAAALETPEDPADVAPPARLGAELATLAQVDPARYGDVARIIETLLSTSR